VSEAAALTGAVSLLERSIAYLLGNLRLVKPASLSRPVPDGHGDLGALLVHIEDSLGVLTTAVTVDEPVAVTTEDPIAAVRAAAHRTLAGWAVARPTGVVVGPRVLSATIVATAGAIEIAAHGWDIARACGWRRPVPPTLAEEMLDLLPLFVAEPYRYRCFAPPVEIGERECAGDRLIANLGRRPPDPVERRYLQSRAALLLTGW
jgi:uncharacterized protein (TIGR03086 family)